MDNVIAGNDFGNPDLQERVDLDLDAIEAQSSFKQIGQAVAVVDELGNLHEHVNRSDDITKTVQSQIEIAVEQFYKVGQIGAPEKVMADLQNHTHLSIKEATCESLKSEIQNLWARIVAVVKKAVEWMKVFLARVLGLEKKTERRLDAIKKLSARAVEARTFIASRARLQTKTIQVNFDTAMKFFFDEQLNPTNKSAYGKLQAEAGQLRNASRAWNGDLTDEKFFTRKTVERSALVKGMDIVEVSEDIGGWKLYRVAKAFPRLNEDEGEKYYKAMNGWVRSNDFRVDAAYMEERGRENFVEVEISKTNFQALEHELRNYHSLTEKMRGDIKEYLNSMEVISTRMEREVRGQQYADVKEESLARAKASLKASIFSKMSLGPQVQWTRRLDSILFTAVRQIVEFAQVQVTHLEAQANSLK